MFLLDSFYLGKIGGGQLQEGQCFVACIRGEGENGDRYVEPKNCYVKPI